FPGMFHQIFGFPHIHETAGYDIRSRKDGIAVAFQRHDYDHDSVFRQMLTVAKHDVSHVSHTQSVYKDSSRLDTSGDLSAVFIQFQNISGGEDKYIFLWYAQVFRHMFLSGKMTVFSMYRNRVFRTDQRI